MSARKNRLYRGLALALCALCALLIALCLALIPHAGFAWGAAFVLGLLLIASRRWYVRLRKWQAPTFGSIAEMRARGTGTRSIPERLAQVGKVPEPYDPQFIDKLVERLGRRPKALLPILNALVRRYRYLPPAAIVQLRGLLDIRPQELDERAGPGSKYRQTPTGRHYVRVCQGPICSAAGGPQLRAEVRRHLDIPSDADTDRAGLFTVDNGECMGCCPCAPLMLVDQQAAGHMSPGAARQALDEMRGLERDQP